MKYLMPALLFLLSFDLFAQPAIHGEIWKDVDGNTINAHGAGILFHDGIYYMFGEIKKGKTWLVPGQQWEDYRVPAGGVSCYSSKDLTQWKYEGVALSSTVGDATNELDTSKGILPRGACSRRINSRASSGNMPR